MPHPKTAEQLQKRQRALQALISTGESFAHLLCRPAAMAEQAASRKRQPTFIETLITGQKPDCPL